MTRSFGDFGGTCLIGAFEPDPRLLLPDTSVFGIPKSGSYLLGTWRDDDGVMYRTLRGVRVEDDGFAFGFSNEGADHLEPIARDSDLYRGPVTTTQAETQVTFAAADGGDAAPFQYVHEPDVCHWHEAGIVEVSGRLIGPGVQWLHPWPEGGGCFTATLKYASEGRFLDRPVTGFIAHEIHYMPSGMDWYKSRYGQGMEICWQHMANEYDDGTFASGTFAFGTDGWGFAMVHDEHGGFHATTDVRMEATVRPSGYPETVTYTFGDQSWTWEIDPKGERPRIADGAMIGADGMFRRVGDTRRVVRSLGNSDWWTDGRYEASLA